MSFVRVLVHKRIRSLFPCPSPNSAEPDHWEYRCLYSRCLVAQDGETGAASRSGKLIMLIPTTGNGGTGTHYGVPERRRLPRSVQSLYVLVRVNPILRHLRPFETALAQLDARAPPRRRKTKNYGESPCPTTLLSPRLNEELETGLPGACHSNAKALPCSLSA